MQRPEADCLYPRAEVEAVLDQMASELNQRCGDEEWLVLCVMNGALMMTGALLQRVDFALKLDHVKVSRYHETTRGSDLHWHSAPQTKLQDCNVLLLDDIFDEGITLAALVDYCREHGAKQVLSAVLIDKLHERKQTDYVPDVIGMTCPDRYVFGFGMDYEGYWRNSSDIFALPGAH